MFGLRPGRISKLGIVGGGSGRRPSLALDFTGPQAVVNQVRNSVLAGSAVGTPGTLPTNWNVGGSLLASGVNQTVVGSGIEGGIPYVDVQFVGTTTAPNTFLNIFFESLTQVPTVFGQTWTGSFYLRVVGGSLANLAPSVNVNGRVIGGTNSESLGSAIVPTGAALISQRFSQVDTLSNAATVWANASLSLNVSANAAPISVILRIGAPQLELGAVANSWVPTSGAANSNIDSRLTTVRAAGGATVVDSTGTLALAPANTARVNYSPARQLLANTTTSLFIGASPLNAISVGVVPPLFPGTPVLLHTRAVGDSNLGSTPAVTPLVVSQLTVSVYVWIPAAWVGTNVSIDLEGTGVTGSTLANTGLRDQWQRIQFTTTSATVGGTFAFMRSTAAAGQLTYSTGWQIEYGSVATAYQPSTGTVVTTASLGLLVEETRTNGIRNPRLEGSSPGTPGTMPTNVQIGNANGLTTSVVGSGYENGIPYVDVSFVGTTTGSGANIAFENANIIAATVGQTWSNSFYCRLVGGSLTNITAIQCEMFTIDAGAGFLNVYATSMTPPTAAPLSTQRAVGTFTIAEATTAFVQTLTQINTGTGVAVNVTLRLGLPQTELGAFVTSPISPTPAAQLATTRAVDVVSMPVGPWFNASIGTLAVDAMLPQIATANQLGLVMLVDSGAFADVYEIRNQSSGNDVRIIAFSTNVNRGANGLTPIVAGVPFKAAGTYNGPGLLTSIALNGVFGVSAGVAGPAVASITQLVLSGRSGPANGYVRRVRYWPRVQIASDLQAFTA